MKLRVNGTVVETAAGTIGMLLEELGIPRQTALVEHNAEPAARDEWDRQVIREGDRVEILRVAAGG